jgi:hypothetical protein
MSNAFLIFAVVLNAGFALAVFWWVFREYRRANAAKPVLTDRSAVRGAGPGGEPGTRA